MVILLNCSFRGEKSNSSYFLELLKENLTTPSKRRHLCYPKDRDALYEELRGADALVLGMPLYVDGAPAQAVQLMEELYEKNTGELSGLRVYVITNLGFYESSQTHILLSIVQNWCQKMGMTYGGGLAIGAGEMMGGLRTVPMDKGPNREMGEGLKELAFHIDKGFVMPDLFTEPSGFSRRMYMLMANSSWAPQAKENGVKRKEIKRKRP